MAVRYFEPYPTQIGSYVGYREISQPTEVTQAQVPSKFNQFLSGLSNLAQTIAGSYRDIKLAELQTKTYPSGAYLPVSDSREIYIVPEQRKEQGSFVLLPPVTVEDSTEEKTWQDYLPLLGLVLFGLILIKEK